MREVTARPVGLFRWLRWRLMAHSLEVHWQMAKARLFTIVICSLIIIAMVFSAAWEGFRLLQQQSLLGSDPIVRLLFDILFLMLGVMLIFSGGLILYGSLFSSPETEFLLSAPVADDHVFAYKFQGAVGFSSWAFVLLGVPVLAAYGVVFHVQWHFWVAVPLFLAGFLLIPGSVGALACLAVVNLAPRRRKQVLIAALVAVGVLIIFWAYRLFRSLMGHASLSDRDALSDLLGQFAFASAAWIPSHWLTRGLNSAARGDVSETLFRLVLVWSNGLLLYLFATVAAWKWYRRGYNRLASGGEFRKRYEGHWIDVFTHRILGGLNPQTRFLIVKDFRTFRRDPRQWAQILIFAGLAMVYFGNSRQLYRSDLGRSFQHGVAFINLTAVCMLLCAYMGRFIYPMLSLEGRKFWILGLMPLSRRRLLFGKFAFAAAGSLAIAVPLVLASDLLLELPSMVVLLHCLTIVCVSAGLSGLAVGIGAVLPNFRETDPSKIAVGFGGTMNLLAGLMFLLIEIGIIAGPYHFAAMLEGTETTGRPLGATEFLGMALGAVLATVAMLWPLRAGVRALEQMEF